MLLFLLLIVKLSSTGDSCNDPEKLKLLLLDPTWAEMTSEAPRVVNSLAVHSYGLMALVELLTTLIPIGRLRSNMKKTGTFSVSEGHARQQLS